MDPDLAPARLGQEPTARDYHDLGGALVGFALGAGGANMILRESGVAQALGIGFTVVGTAILVAELKDLYR